MVSALTSADEAAPAIARRLAHALANAGDDPFAGVIAATRTPIAITDPRLPDNPIIYVNDSFCDLTGYSRDESVGRNCRFLQGPETSAEARAAIRDAITAQQPVEVDLLNYRKDGIPFWNRVAIAPLFDADRNLAFLFASQTDVTGERERLILLEEDNAALNVQLTDRLRAQRESEAKLRVATEAAGIGVWEVELPGLVMTATPTMVQIYGLAPGVAPGIAAIRAITHPDDLAEAAATFERAVRGRDGDDYRTTYRVRRDDGSTGWIEARGEVIRRADGRPLRLVGVSQDVTARRLAEARLEFNEESLRLATEASGVGTWDLDLTTDALTWTDRTRAMFGIAPGVPCSMVDFYGGLHPDDREATSAAFAASLNPAVRSVYDVEFRTIGKDDGVVRWVAAKGKGLFDGDRCVRAIGTAIDITARRRSEATQRFLYDLSDAIGRLSNPQAVKREAMLRLGAVLDVNRVGYGEIDDHDGATALLDCAYLRDAAPLTGRVALADFGMTLLERLRRGETVADGDVAVEPEADLAAWNAIGTRAHVSVPVIRDGRLRGTLFALRNDPCLWEASDVALLEAVAARTWDAVERARAEAESHASEARLRAVIEAAPIGLVFADAADGRITGGNAQIERLLRHPVLPSPSVTQYREYVSFHPDGRQVEGHEYPLARALAGDERPELEVLYRRGDGTDAWLRFIAAPVRAPDGAVVGGVVASLDIDRERRAETALRELNTTLERRVAEAIVERDAIWRESRDLLLVVDRDGMIEAVNPAWTETLGYTEEQLVRHRYSEFAVAEDAPLNDAVLATIGDSPLRSYENRYRHADGSIRDFAWSASFGANGKLYCVARDVTEAKAAAAQLEATQEALRQAQKMEAVGQLTGGIAHDFNNMLGIVLGSLDLLGRRLAPDDTRARRYVEAASDGARRAATLTQRLLAFSRRQPLQPEAVDVNRLVAGMSDLLRGSLGGGIQLETVLAGGLWPVHVDPNQLENVVLNLAINARDAMDGDGRVTIETANAHLDDRYVAAEIGVAAGQYVLIAVTDAGAGMSPDVVAKAFDPFFTTKVVGKGTGLGLSQVYGFIKQSGGHVKIYSEVAVGTTVKLYLPRLVGGVPALPTGAAATVALASDTGEVVLVVEDEPGVRAVSVDALRELGYRVLEANSAAVALALLDAHPVDLLFTDIVMPEVNGAKLAEMARAKRPGLKVLFTTGYTRNAVVHNGVVDPGVALIGKPFTIDALAAKVRAILDAS